MINLPIYLLLGLVNGAIFTAAFVFSWVEYLWGDGDVERMAFCTFVEVFAGPLLIGSIQALRGKPSGPRLLRLGAFLCIAYPEVCRVLRHLESDPDYLLYMSGGPEPWLPDDKLAGATVSELIAWLASPYSTVRFQAAYEMIKRKPPPEVVWPVLVEMRADECCWVRMEVVRGAVHMAVPPKQAVPVLRELLADTNELVQSTAAWGLERLGQGSQAEILAELVRQGRRKGDAEHHAASDPAR